ncbi:MAG: hypothetical protein NDJ24_06335 [Alphaproteobacteria bacterium]|nr:hypothetical protein [Alphaproteobacteria bacterium]
MDVSVETYLVVALAFAVFSAVTAIGSSLVLGIGFERLRAGFEVVRKQTGYFSDAIFTLEKRVDEQEVKIASGGMNTDKAESLVRHAENLLTELTHVARGMKADAEGPAKEESQPMTIDVKNEALPTTIAHYASQWGDLGKDDKRQITLM